MKYCLILFLLLISCSENRSKYIFKGQIKLLNGSYEKAYIRYYRTWKKNDEMQTVVVGNDGRFEISFDQADQYYFHFLHEGYPEEDFYFNMEKEGVYELQVNLDKAIKPDNFKAVLLTSLSDYDSKNSIVMDEYEGIYTSSLRNIPKDIDTVYYEVTNSLKPLIESKLFTQNYKDYALVKNGIATIQFNSNDFYTDMNRSELRSIQNLAVETAVKKFNKVRYEPELKHFLKHTRTEDIFTDEKIDYLSIATEEIMKDLATEFDSLQFIYEVYDVNKIFIPEHSALYRKAESMILREPEFAKRIKLSFFNLASSRIEKKVEKNTLITDTQADSLEREFILEEIDKILLNTKSTQRRIELMQYKETTIRSFYDKDRLFLFYDRFIKEFPDSFVADGYKKARKEINIVGTDVSDFAFKDLEKRTISLSEFKGKFLVLNFWSTLSHSYDLDFQKMIEEYEKFDKEKVEIVSICLDYQDLDLNDILNKMQDDWMYKMEWTHLQIQNNELREQLNITGYSRNFLVDPKGFIILKDEGLRVSVMYSRLFETVMHEMEKYHQLQK